MAIVQSRVAAVQAIYAAYYNRPADVGGLDFWTNQLQAANGNLTTIINAFGNSAEANALYTGSVENKVNQVYLALFNRPAEVAGLNFYVAEINAGRISLAGAAQAIAAGAQGADKTAFDNKVAASTLFTNGLDTAPEVLAYSQNGAAELGRAFLATVTATAPATQALVDAAIIALDTGSTFTLTAGTDTASANIFNAGLVQNASDRVNALQDEDTLTGTGVDPVLNVTLGNANDNGGSSITPTLNNITEVNVAFTGNSNAGNQANLAVNRLDLQDSTATVREINITRVTDVNSSVQIDNITSVPTTMSLSSIQSGTASVGLNFIAGAAAGAADTTTLTLNRVTVNGLSVEETSTATVGTGVRLGTAGLSDGVETINLVSATGANKVGTFSAEDLKTLVISGSQNLTLGTTSNTTGAQGVEATRYAGGLTNVGGSLTSVNASALTGKLDYNIGNEINAGQDGTSGLSVNLTVTGGTADDTFRLTGNVDALDQINGGAGRDTLQLLGGGAQTVNATAANTATVTAVEALDIRTGHDTDRAATGVVAANLGLDAAKALVTAANGFTAAQIAAAQGAASTAALITAVDGLAADTVSVNALAIADLNAITIRNEGQSGAAAGSVSQFEAMTVNLRNVNAATANALTIAHGTTGNSGIANNTINLLSTVAGVTTAGLTIVDGINANPQFNVRFLADSDNTSGNATNSIVNINLVDNDTELNTVRLDEAQRHTGTLTITGTSNNFFNLDAQANAYRYAQDGTANNGTFNAPGVRQANNGVDAAERLQFSTIDSSAYAGGVILRAGLAQAAGSNGAQTIRFGAGNDTVIFDVLNSNNAGFTISDSLSGGAGNDVLAFDGQNSIVTVQATEFQNTTGFEVIRFLNNGAAAVGTAFGQNSYNLSLSDAMLTANAANGRVITIINDSDSRNDDGIITTAEDTTSNNFINNTPGVAANVGVTIDARQLNSGFGFNYNGDETTNFDVDNDPAATNYDRVGTNDRFIFADRNINGTTIIDGGAVYGVAAVGAAAIGVGNLSRVVTNNARNNDVLEVRNSATVDAGDLSNISNVGIVEFTNDTASIQTSNLELNNTVVDTMVNSTQVAGAVVGGVTNGNEQLVIRAIDNVAGVNVVGTTQLFVNAAGVTNAALSIDVTTASANDIIRGTAGADIINSGAGDDLVTGNGGNDTINVGTGSDTLVFGSNLATNGIDAITGFTAGALAGGGDVINVAAFTFLAATTNTVVELANIANINAAGIADNRIIVLTDDNVTAITAADIKTALDAGNLDTTNIGDRLLVLDGGAELRVFRLNNIDITNNDNIVVEQLATLVGVNDIAAGQFIDANFVTA